jgi:hypothetical protein
MSTYAAAKPHAGKPFWECTPLSSDHFALDVFLEELVTQEGMLDTELALGFRVVGELVGTDPWFISKWSGAEFDSWSNSCVLYALARLLVHLVFATYSNMDLACKGFGFFPVPFPNLPNTGPLREVPHMRAVLKAVFSTSAGLADLKPHLHPLLSFLTPLDPSVPRLFFDVYWRLAPVCRKEVRQSLLSHAMRPAIAFAPRKLVRALLQDDIPCACVASAVQKRWDA